MSTGLSNGTELDAHDLLRTLWDIEQIKQLKARYFRFVDERNWSDLRDLFTADCVFTSGGRTGVGGADEFVARVQQLITPGTSVHHGHMPEITITGPDSATGIWSMFDYVEIDGAVEGRRGFRAYGHYLEEYRRSPKGNWLISSWTLTRLRVDKL